MRQPPAAKEAASIGAYHMYLATNMIDESHRNIQLRIDESNSNIQVRSDESNRNIQLNIDELFGKIGEKMY
jgi:hypothetical protein